MNTIWLWAIIGGLATVSWFIYHEQRTYSQGFLLLGIMKSDGSARFGLEWAKLTGIPRGQIYAVLGLLEDLDFVRRVHIDNEAVMQGRLPRPGYQAV